MQPLSLLPVLLRGFAGQLTVFRQQRDHLNAAKVQNASHLPTFATAVDQLRQRN